MRLLIDYLRLITALNCELFVRDIGRVLADMSDGDLDFGCCEGSRWLKLRHSLVIDIRPVIKEKLFEVAWS